MLHSTVIAVALAAGMLASSQSQPPVFRVEANVVTVEFSLFRVLPFIRVRRPYTGLTQEEVTLAIDKKNVSGATLMRDDKRPGHYLVTGDVPDEFRDGSEHAVEVILIDRGKRPKMVIPKAVTIPKKPDA